MFPRSLGPIQLLHHKPKNIRKELFINYICSFLRNYFKWITNGIASLTNCITYLLCIISYISNCFIYRSCHCINYLIDYILSSWNLSFKWISSLLSYIDNLSSQLIYLILNLSNLLEFFWNYLQKFLSWLLLILNSINAFLNSCHTLVYLLIHSLFKG